MTSTSPAPSSANERIASHARAAQLVGLPFHHRLRIVREDRSYSVPSFIELAIGLAQGFDIGREERDEWAQLAVEAARNGSSRHAKELEPLAWATLGNTRRVLGRLALSRIAFRRCRELRHLLADSLQLSETFSLEASYCWAIMDFARAADLSAEAVRLATPRAEDCVIGKYEQLAAGIASEAGDLSVATTMGLSAAERIDPSEQPRLAFGAGQGLTMTAIRLGHIDTAICGLLRLDALSTRITDTKTLLYREGSLAKIAIARGHLAEAECRLQGIRSRYNDHQMAYEAAQVDFELARLAAKGERWPTAAHLAARAVGALRAAGSPREARLANCLLREAVKECPGSGTPAALAEPEDLPKPQR